MITCERCGGTVLSNYGELTCLNCAREYDEQFEIIVTKVTYEKPITGARRNGQRQSKYRGKVIYRKNW